MFTPAAAALALASVLGLYVWITMVLLRQNGRLIARVDALEAHFDASAQAVQARFTEGDKVPPVQLRDLDGNIVDVSLPRSRKTLLVFFDPENGQCQSMIPDIKTAERVRLDDAPELIVVGRGPAGAHRQFGFMSTILLDPGNASRQVFGVEAYPSAVLLDDEGRFASSLATNYVGVFQLMGLVPFVPTHEDTVDAMLRLAAVTRDDLVYDLGCGDGRVVIAAARKYGARGVGVDINVERIEESRSRATEAGVESLVRFERANLFDADLHAATVVTLYLLPEMNVRLRPKLLAELRPGTRVVSHGFDMEDWKPDREVQSNGDTLYLWTIPDRRSRP